MELRILLPADDHYVEVASGNAGRLLPARGRLCGVVDDWRSEGCWRGAETSGAPCRLLALLHKMCIDASCLKGDQLDSKRDNTRDLGGSDVQVEVLRVWIIEGMRRGRRGWSGSLASCTETSSHAWLGRTCCC